MSIEFLAPEVDELTPRIAVIGVGGAGGNAIANMMRADVQGVDFLVANTDAQALKQSTAPQRIQLGAKITQGLGAGVAARDRARRRRGDDRPARQAARGRAHGASSPRAWAAAPAPAPRRSSPRRRATWAS